MNFEKLIEFKKDLKTLLKKYRSLQDDLDFCIIEVKKIACKSLKVRGINSGMRLIYVYFPDENKIVFIEIYHKGKKEIEDCLRIKKHFEFN